MRYQPCNNNNNYYYYKQSTVVVTHYILIASYFTYPEGMESVVEIVPKKVYSGEAASPLYTFFECSLRDLNPDLPHTGVYMCRSGYTRTQTTELQSGASILGGLALTAPIEKLGGRFFGTLGGSDSKV